MNNIDNKKVIIFSAPSGSGKTTIIKRLLTFFPEFEFSISATSRQPRTGETDGLDYYFLTQESFEEKVNKNLFLEVNPICIKHYMNLLGRNVGGTRPPLTSASKETKQKLLLTKAFYET